MTAFLVVTAVLMLVLQGLEIVLLAAVLVGGGRAESLKETRPGGR